jgi:hypothetical protein
MSAGPTFTLRIRGRSGQAGIHALRAVLKELLRRHQFICLDVREERDAAMGDAVTVPTRPTVGEDHV